MRVPFRELIAVSVIALVAVGCNGGIVTSDQQVTLSQLPTDEFNSSQELFDYLNCEYVSIGSGWDTGVAEFDDKAALALAREHASDLGVTEPVETIRQLGSELWVVGTAKELVLGTVTRGSVAFCGWESGR